MHRAFSPIYEIKAVYVMGNYIYLLSLHNITYLNEDVDEDGSQSQSKSLSSLPLYMRMLCMILTVVVASPACTCIRVKRESGSGAVVSSHKEDFVKY